MAHKYAQIAFTKNVRAMQEELNSRAGYAGMDTGEDYNYLLSEVEASFISQRDSFYMASVSETDWPYVQHRGGPEGFLKVIDASTLGFADYKGNRQYVSAGNFRNNDRVALFFMDYPNKRRLKMLGRIRQVADNDWQTLATLEDENYRAVVERGFVIKIEAFDWNCPQHITPRYSEQEIEGLIEPISKELAQLRSAQQTSNKSEYPQELGDGELPLVISGIRQLTPRVRAIELRHENGVALPKFTAGSHIAIPVQLADGKIAWRHYSLSSNPRRTDCYEIAIFNEVEHHGGSEAIHKYFSLGLKLNCKKPDNYFPLHNHETPAVLIAGGIGITPIKAMALELIEQDREFTVHYSGRSKNEMAYHDRLNYQLKDKVNFHVSSEDTKLDLHQLVRGSAINSHFYICGPNTMIDELVGVADELAIEPERIHFERFGAEPIKQTQSFSVSLTKSQKTVEVSAEQSILDALLNAGIDVPYSCKAGLCKSCVVQANSLNIEHNDMCLTDEEQTSGKLCLCVSRAVGDNLAIEL